MEEVHEVVISGMSGRFPNCESVEELYELLKNKVNLVSEEGRWEAGELNVPHQVGKISDPYVFDLTYFGIHRKLGAYMDPNVKLVLENSIAAIHDAGLSLQDVIGKEVATIVGSSLLETEYEVILNNHRMDQTILSHSACMQANRLAYYLDLKGPSYMCESGWNGAVSGLRHARSLIARGIIEAAIVSASSLLFLPQVSYHYDRLGRLNGDGKTKCFSTDADGYSRSEASVVFLLQRKENALRNYGTLMGVDVNQNGSKEGSISDCSSFDSKVMKRIYEEKEIDPSSVAFIEAAGCASKTVDARELNAISEVFLKNRSEPLLIGSVKSNLGHTEAASSFVGIVKAIISAEHDLIPPNLHYSGPNELVPALVSGQLQVATEPERLKGDLLAVNNISALGAFSHVLLKRNPKTKKRKCEVGVLPPDGLPRLVLLSGREVESLNQILDKVEKMPIDEEFIALTHRAFGRGVKRHMFRGYTLLHNIKTTQKFRQVKEYAGGKQRPLWFVFAGMGSQWAGMAADLMEIPTFARAIHYAHELLVPFGLDLIKIVTNPDPDTFNDILNCFVGIASVQVGLVDILKQINLVPDGFVGHSLGELGCAYADGTFTAKQMIMGAYYRGKISADSGISNGLMAAVGKGYQYMKDKLPEGIDIACRNSTTSCTISGPADLVQKCVDKWAGEGIFVRTVSSGGIAYHSRYIQQLGPAFFQALKELVPDPKPRSANWISTSVPEANWDSEEAQLSSAEYHTNNLLSPVLFEEALTHIPKDAIILEVAPRGLLQAIIKRALPDATYIPMASKDDNGHLHVLSAFGKLYNEGVYVDVEKLYPAVEFPVSRGTPSLAPLMTWIHNESWKDYAFLERKKENLTVRDLYFNGSGNSNLNFFANFKIYNNTLVPPSAYIDTIFDIIHKVSKKDVKTVLLEKITFKKMVKFGEESPVRVAIQEGTGCWEFCVEKDTIVSGRIEANPIMNPCEKVKPEHRASDSFTSEEVYFYLNQMGLSINEQYNIIKSLSISEDGTSAEADIFWEQNWLTFLESLFLLVTFTNSFYKNKLHILKSITQMYIDLNLFNLQQAKVVKVSYNKTIGVLWSEGIEIHRPIVKEAIIEAKNDYRIEFQVPKYVSCERIEGRNEDLFKFIDLSTKVILNNLPEKKLIVFSLSENKARHEEINVCIAKSFKPKDLLFTSLPNDSGLLFAQNINLSNSYVLVINESTALEYTLKTLNRSKAGYLLCQNIESSSSLACVLSQKIGSHTYFLYKTVPDYKLSPVSISMSVATWKEDLKKKLEEVKGRIVYLTGFCSCLNYIHDVVQECSRFENSDLIRFVFMGSKSDAFKPEIFKEHLSKDIRINILKNGKWGTYAFYPLEFSSPRSILKTLSSAYQFKNIVCTNGLSLKALGLNITSMIGEEKKLGVFEYSGTQDGKSICGLAKLNEESATLEPDPVYVWEKPAHMSHVDVAAVFIPYLTAYRLLEVECQNCVVPIRRVLVINGELTVSQAIIKLALKKGLEVYTTYDDVLSTKKGINDSLSELNENNILRGDKCLDSTIMRKTKGEGMHIIVNTSNDPSMLLPLMKSLGQFSYFFQLSAKETEPGVTMGMYVFLSKVSVHGIQPEMLLNLSNEEKYLLKELFDAGFKNGDIKPIKTTILPSSTFNSEAILKIKDDFALNQKFVVDLDNKTIQNGITENQFLCNPEKLYIMLGDENNLWFDLIQWFISRGGRKFTIMAKRISPLLTRRLSVLLSKNKSVQVNYYLTPTLETAEETHKFISQTEEQVKIGGLFVFGKKYFITMEEIIHYLNETRVILIGENTEMAFNWKSCSRKHLAIEVPKNQSDFSSILQNLDSLLYTTEPIVRMKEFPADINKIDTSYLDHWQHLPDSVSSIVDLAKTSGQPEWKEVRTCCPNHTQSREVSPVFIIPPLRKDQLDKLVRSIFHPAFTAVIPPHVNSLQELAEQLYQGLKRFNCGVFTIICADWSYMLGLELGRVLEKNGKTVSLVLLDIHEAWTSLILKSIYDKAKKAILNNNSDGNTVSLFEKGFDTLKNRVELVCNSSLQTQPKLRGFVHIFVRKNPTKGTSHISECCERPVMVHSTACEDYLEMLDSPETAHKINTIVLVEHKDNAHPVARDYENIKLIISQED